MIGSTHKQFLEDQFERRGIPRNSGDYAAFLLAKTVCQMQGKLNVKTYHDSLEVAAEYTGWKGDKRDETGK